MDNFSFSWLTNQKRLRTEIITKQYPYVTDVFRELVSNSIDAKANNISIEIYENLLDGIDQVIIYDNGMGMTQETVQNIFSLIATDNKQKNNKQIGQFGIGRFSVYTIGNLIEWETRAKNKDGIYSTIKFTMDASSNEKVECDYHIAKESITGTTIRIKQIHADKFNALKSFSALKNSLSSVFAPFLISGQKQFDLSIKLYKADNEKPGAYIEEKFEKIDFSSHIIASGSETISDSGISGTLKHLVLDKNIQMDYDAQVNFSTKNVTVREEKLNVPEIPNHKYWAIVNSDDFNIDSNRSQIIGLDNNFNKFKHVVYKACEDYTREKIKELNIPFIQIAQELSFYPERFKKNDLSSLERVNKIVYDKCLDLVNNKLNIQKQSENVQHIIFSFIDKALSDNNFISLFKKIIGLNDTEIKELDSILSTLKFEEISKLYNSTVGRLEFLNSFESLIYDYKTFNISERTQLQKIVEDNLWLFREEFNLAYFDTRISTILKSENQNAIIETNDLLPDFLLGFKRYDDINGEEHLLLIEIKKPGVPIEESHRGKLIDRFEEFTKNGRFPGTKWHLYLISDKIQEKFKTRSISNKYDLTISDDLKDLGLIEFKALTWSELIKIKKQELNFIQKSIQQDFPYDGNLIKNKYPDLFKEEKMATVSP